MKKGKKQEPAADPSGDVDLEATIRRLESKIDSLQSNKEITALILEKQDALQACNYLIQLLDRVLYGNLSMIDCSVSLLSIKRKVEQMMTLK